MNPSRGNLERREISISGMQLGNYMQYQKTWPLIFRLIGMYFAVIECHILSW